LQAACRVCSPFIRSRTSVPISQDKSRLCCHAPSAGPKGKGETEPTDNGWTSARPSLSGGNVESQKPENQMGLGTGTSDWSTARRILFRFAFAYLLLVNLFRGNSYLMGLWDGVALWAGEHVFGVIVTMRMTRRSPGASPACRPWSPGR
jgi:hypothetical protein